jgi:hypothetical protein
MIVGVPNLEGEDVGAAWYEKRNGKKSEMKVGCSKALGEPMYEPLIYARSVLSAAAQCCLHSAPSPRLSSE